MKVFYHGDKDGQCAGFWVYHSAEITDRLGMSDTKDDFICIDYRVKFPLDKIRKDEQVYIVDYSISPNEMRELLKITKNVTWIDHHITAIEKYKDFEYDIRGVRYNGISGAMLTYCYLHHMTQRGEGEIKPFDISMTKDAPLMTKLVDDWDVWKFEFGDKTRHFQLGSKQYNFQPWSDKWLDLLKDETNVYSLILEGQTIQRYVEHWSKNYMYLGFETEFEGYKCYAANIGYANSEYFKSLFDKGYDIFIAFVYDSTQYIHSLYTLNKDIDVSKIALKYGGGGHFSCAGFQTKFLLFKKGSKRRWIRNLTKSIVYLKNLKSRIVKYVGKN